MDIDITRHFGPGIRVVSHHELDGKVARAIAFTRVYETDIDDVWDALTNPERLPRWFLPVTGDLRVGGRYQLEGNAGGEITRCDRPRELALTWVFAENISWVTVRLSKGPGESTTLRLEHVAHQDDHWEQYGPGAGGVGWDLAMVGLDEHLTTKRDNDAKGFEAWMASDSGRDFVRRCSDAWGRAEIADGTEEALAITRAERTFAFYTGAAEDPGGH